MACGGSTSSRAATMALRAGGGAARVHGLAEEVGGRKNLRVARPRPAAGEGLRAAAGENGVAMIMWAMSRIMLRRLAQVAG